ncbi:MAG: alpha/beta fold hydrolase [Myxococcales bacterium]|jgi:predicted alpha/beta hydrolase
MGVSAGYYGKLAESIAEHGVAAAVLELRGQGESEVQPARDVDFGYRQLLDDLGLALKSLRARNPGLPIVLVGHSLGGHLSMLQLAFDPESIDALALIATATPHHGPYRGAARCKVFLGTRVVRFVSLILGYYPGHRLGFGGLQPRTLMREWTDMARSGSYALEGAPVDVEAALEEVSTPILALVIDGDEVAPRSACEAITAKLTNARVDWCAIGAPRLSPRACDHQRWAREPAPFAEEISAFIGRRLPSAAQVESRLSPIQGADLGGPR